MGSCVRPAVNSPTEAQLALHVCASKGLEWAEQEKRRVWLKQHFIVPSDGGLDVLCVTVGQNMMLHKRIGSYKYHIRGSLGKSGL